VASARLRVGSYLDRTEALADRPLGAAILVIAALAAYALEAWAWPLNAGRDGDEYLLSYLQLFDRHPLLPWSLEFRTPLAGLVTGPVLQLGGATLAEVFAAAAYAASILVWARVARVAGRRASVLVALLLLVYPGYAGMFHEFGAELVLGLAFAAWSLVAVRAVTAPTVRRFAALGLGAAVLALIRPGNAVAAVLVLLPLLLRATWRRRLTWTAAAAAAAILPMGLWTLHNGLVVGDDSFARGSAAIIPFYRVFLVDDLISPRNGPSSRKLVSAIQRDLVTREPYKGYGVTTAEILARPSFRVHEDLMSLSDQVWGWKSAYGTLRSAAIEAIRRHPGAYARGVLDTLLGDLRRPYYRSDGGGGSPPPTGATVGVLPAPSEGQIVPGGQNIWISTPDDRIRQVWTSPTSYHFTFVHPGDAARFQALTSELDSLLGGLPARSGNVWLATQLDRLSHLYPALLYLAALGLGLLFVRRPACWLALLTPAAAALIVLAVTALGSPDDPHYVLPFAPAFLFLFAGGLAGERRAHREAER
jgi:hypothetical protein